MAKKRVRMAKKRVLSRTRSTIKKSPAKRKKTTPADRRRLVCPDCGFKAAHVMGLGRHRSARHGAISKRQAMGLTPGSARADPRLANRVALLERRYDRLLKGLARVLKEAKK